MFSSKEYDKIGSDWHDLGTALQNNPARDHELLFIDLVVKSDSVGWGPLQESKLRNYEGKELHSSVYVEEAYAQRKMAIRTKKYQYIKAPTEESAVCNCTMEFMVAWKNYMTWRAIQNKITIWWKIELNQQRV